MNANKKDKTGIIFLVQYPDTTGASRIATGHMLHLLKSGYKIGLIYAMEPVSSTDDSKNHFLDELKDAGVVAICEEGLWSGINWKTLSSIRLLKSRIDASVIVGVNQRDRPVACLAGAILGMESIAYILNEHRFYGATKAFKKRAYCFLLRLFARKIIVPTQQMLDEVIRINAGRKNKMHIVPNPADTSMFSRAESSEAEVLRNQFGVENGELMITCVARLQPQKGILQLVESFRIVVDNMSRPVKLVIAGDSHNDSYKNEISNAIDTLQLENNIVLLGSTQRIPDLLSCSDIYAHSAIWEGFPVAVLEAMAAQLPSIFTDCAGELPGFIDGEHGFSVPAGDPDALAKKILTVAGMAAPQTRKMGQMARNLVLQRYDTNLVARHFESIVTL